MSLALGTARLQLANWLLRYASCLAPTAPKFCARSTYFCHRTFCVQFQRPSYPASDPSSLAAAAPTAFSGRQSGDYPGIWTSEAAPETQAQEQAASTLLETRMYLITRKACPSRSSRNCCSCPDFQSCPGRLPAAGLTEKHPRKERGGDGRRPVTKM